MAPNVRTAADEFYGGSRFMGTSGGVSKLPFPFGPGGARLIYGEPSAIAQYDLPLAAFTLSGDGLTPGALPAYTIVNKGTYSITVRNAIGITIGIISPNQVGRVYLISKIGNPFGLWAFTSFATVTSATLPLRQYHKIVLTGTRSTPFVIRDFLVKFRSFDADLPCDVHLELGANASQGSNVDGVPALDTGEMFSGSSVLLVIPPTSSIRGKGGDGGRGATPTPGLLSSAGGDGSPAIRTYHNMRILNSGSILGGGGGGGGGGNASATQGGGGGGGGAGYRGGAKGFAGGGGGNAGTLGSWIPGSGGSSPVGNGGDGGAHGAAGSAGTGGSSGGAAGDAIQRLSSVTVTKLRAGTIVGTETTF